MDAVGDGGDWNCARPLHAVHALPHRARHFSVQLRDTIHARSKTQAKHCHTDRLALIRRVLAAKRLKLSATHTCARKRSLQRAPHPRRVVTIMPRCDWCVRGKHCARTHAFDRVIVRESIASKLREQLKRRECCMTFVEMNLRRREIERTQRTHATDTKQHLLAHPQVWLTLVETFGE